MNDNEKQHLIIPSQLTAAREAVALSIEEVAHRFALNPEELANWEKGLSEPPVEQLWELAELYGRTTDFFVKQTAPMPSDLKLRIAGQELMTDLSLEVRKVIARFEELCRAEGELERLAGKTRTIKIERYAVGLSPEELAWKERHRLSLADRPIRNLRTLLEDQGVRIFLLEVPENGLSGLSWWHEGYGPCILVNAKDPSGRRTYTMAHEYAHLLRFDPPTVCDLNVDVAEERLCTKFAAVFLMPEADVRKFYQQKVGFEGAYPTNTQLGTLAGRYGVSLEAMGRRLEYLELILPGTTEAKIAEWEAGPIRRKRAKGPIWRRSLGEVYVGLALQAHSQGHISLGKLAQYLNRDIWKVYELIEETKLTPGIGEGD